MSLAVITGGSRGLGRALAFRMLQVTCSSESKRCQHGLMASAPEENLQVVIIGRSETELQSSVKEAEALHCGKGRIHAVVADIGEPDGRAKIVESVRETKIPLRYLIHNAAILGPLDYFVDTTKTEVSDFNKNSGSERFDWDGFRAAFAVNVEAPLFLTQDLAPDLRTASQAGSSSLPSRILHISSGAAHNIYPGMGTYCATKAALYSLYQSLKLELEPWGIEVGSVRPGVVDTDMMTNLRQPLDSNISGRYVDLKNNQPDERIPGTPPPSGALDIPENVACFLAWVILNSPEKVFSEQEWNISDGWHRSEWCVQNS